MQNVPYFSLKLGAAYYNLGAALCNSGHYMKAAQRYLQAKERYPVGSGDWAEVTAKAFEMPKLEECAEVVKPETVVERRGAQGAFGEGFAGGAERCVSQHHAGHGAAWGARRLGGGASLGSGAQGGGQALRAVCGAVRCPGGESRVCRHRGQVPQRGRGHVDGKSASCACLGQGKLASQS